MVDLYIGLGSNLGDRKSVLLQAVEILEKRIGALKSLSAFYETEPWGFVSENPFLNAVAVLQTSLSPEEVLGVTQQVERELGRQQKSICGRYKDRTIDIDILLYGNLIIEEDYCWPENGKTVHLSVPHPLMHERRFVMEPLVEVAAQKVHPVLGNTFQDILAHLKE